MFLFINLQGCYKSEKKETENYKGFAVNIIDVGEGDAILVHFESGENLLIDCGEKSENNFNKIKKCFSFFEVENIDYLILTHIDSDHTGNALDIIKNYNVKTAYIPKILEPEKYEDFNLALNELNSKDIPTKISLIYQSINIENANILFLSQEDMFSTNSSYADFNRTEIPNEKQKNNISPIIYLEYKGVRFLFTGDAESEQEIKVINNYNLGLYERFNVNLTNVDFLKVGHHGASDSSCEKFLQTVNPKNALISVGGNNYYGHPSDETLIRFNKNCPDCMIYRTDRDGTISVRVENNDNVNIVTERQ
ncbi:MAG: MBL fold metallo-hydrolase [Clostridia bacterium]|nr:MBL fold metallo-hydrolase [Clostridia bacterium]